MLFCRINPLLYLIGSGIIKRIKQLDLSNQELDKKFIDNNIIILNKIITDFELMGKNIKLKMIQIYKIDQK